MGIKQLYNDNLRKLPNKYGDVSVMYSHLLSLRRQNMITQSAARLIADQGIIVAKVNYKLNQWPFLPLH